MWCWAIGYFWDPMTFFMFHHFSSMAGGFHWSCASCTPSSRCPGWSRSWTTTRGRTPSCMWWSDPSTPRNCTTISRRNVYSRRIWLVTCLDRWHKYAGNSMHIPLWQPPGWKAWHPKCFCILLKFFGSIKKWDQFRNRFHQEFLRKINFKISKLCESRHPKQGQICIKSKK